MYIFCNCYMTMSTLCSCARSLIAEDFVYLTADVCKLQFQAGFVTPKPEQRWFFNSLSQRCEKFQYGGLFGNENNFLSNASCWNRCKCDSPLGILSYSNTLSCPKVVFVSHCNHENRQVKNATQVKCIVLFHVSDFSFLVIKFLLL